MHQPLQAILGATARALLSQTDLMWPKWEVSNRRSIPRFVHTCEFPTSAACHAEARPSFGLCSGLRSVLLMTTRRTPRGHGKTTPRATARPQDKPVNPDIPETLMTPQELASRWSLSQKTLANHRCNGTGVPYVKIGVAVRYRISDVLDHEHRVAAGEVA
jgi:hypothetical protein